MPATTAAHWAAPSGSLRQVRLSAVCRERPLLSAVLRTTSSVGDRHALARPFRYPKDARHQDLKRVGRDMYRATGWRAAPSNAAPSVV